ncbi:SAM-dependent methyltransferase [Sphingomonas sp. CFBP 13728]|uniref:SAM-dependent methyltransferase n=1 Tax=Sphingomonas sp. CFBP 13728 TaxID=2775294 RepID=UPI00177E0960|nr:SAM-dependent methyltransferase [Sphingomonas sp. CFBP 13728]MBD8617590.1 SAM-dependent methyltransferase [Sphingomonas sp. CFBP 13728]
MSVSHSLQSRRRPNAPATATRPEHDDRWPAVAAALGELRLAKRRSVRIVDADCGAGTLLLRAVRHARSLGFTAIEGRGIDGAPALIGRARAAAASLDDPAIGMSFELADLRAALTEEAEFPADILLCDNSAGRAGLSVAIAAAGRVVIDHPATIARAVAA